MSNPDVIDNLGVSLAGRYTDKFDYSSSSNFGNGELGGHTIIDAQLTYSLTQFNTTVKLGINNLIGETYREAIGGVSIGQTMYLAMSFDKLRSGMPDGKRIKGSSRPCECKIEKRSLINKLGPKQSNTERVKMFS